MSTNARCAYSENLMAQEVPATGLFLQIPLLLIQNRGKLPDQIEGGRQLYLDLEQLAELRELLTTRWDEITGWLKPPAERRIVQARITAMPQRLLDPMPKVMVIFEGTSEEVELFEFYPDEISFNSEEFLGLTEGEARALKTQKDRAYLTS